jgi:hypothetical protein
LKLKLNPDATVERDDERRVVVISVVFDDVK